jgi:hypothetical protein
MSLRGHSLAYLGEPSPEHVVPINFVRPFADAEADALDASLKRINRFSQDQQLYIICELNYAELESTLHEYDENFENYAGNYVSVETITSNISRCILNHLSSFRMLIDHAETAMNRRFGAASPEFLEFKRALSREYDGNFAYRFLYRLRNFVQHLGLPIDSWSRTSEAGGPPAQLQISLSRERLLADRDVWGAIVSEIEGLPAKIPITKYFNDLRPSLENVRKARYQPDLEQLRSDGRMLIALINEITAATNDPVFPVFAIAEPQDEAGSSLHLSFTNLPFHAITAAANL